MRKLLDIVLLCSALFLTTGCDLFEKDYDQDIVSTSTSFKVEGDYEYDSSVDKLFLKVDDIEYREKANLMVKSVKVDLYEENNETVLDTTENIADTAFNLNRYLDNVELSSSFVEKEFDLDNIYLQITFTDETDQEFIEKIEFKKDR